MSEGFTSNVSWQSQFQSKYMSIEQKRAEEDSSAGYCSSATSPSTSGHCSDVNHSDKVDFELNQNLNQNSCNFSTYFDTKTLDSKENATEKSKTCISPKNMNFINASTTFNSNNEHLSKTENSKSFDEEKACVKKPANNVNTLRSDTAEETVTNSVVHKLFNNNVQKTLQDPEVAKKMLSSLFLKISNTKKNSSYFEVISEIFKNKNLNKTFEDLKSLVSKKETINHDENISIDNKKPNLSVSIEEKDYEKNLLAESSSLQLKQENLKKNLEENNGSSVESSLSSSNLQNCIQHHQNNVSLKTKFDREISSIFNTNMYQKTIEPMETMDSYSDFSQSSVCYDKNFNSFKSKLPSSIVTTYHQENKNSKNVSQNLYTSSESSQQTNLKTFQTTRDSTNILGQRNSPQNKRPRLRASANGAGEFINGFWIPTRSRSCYVCGKSFKNIYR